MTQIIFGDVLDSKADAILHQVNCQGVMNSGVAKQVRLKYPDVFKCYKMLCDSPEYARRNNRPSPLLGEVQAIQVDDSPSSQLIVNLFAQDYYGYDGKRYTDYDALRSCLRTVNLHCKGMTLAIPYKMSCGRGGADWETVSEMIEQELKDCTITYYRLPDGGNHDAEQ